MKFAAVVAIIPLCESPIWLFSCKTLASSVTEASLVALIHANSWSFEFNQQN